ncbi:MAG TPA: CRTAC1 family protein [Vicinamibacterales bacterium]|nr:CRTAC1 family protein [Vicinamibacterales bacterium]
MPAPLRLETGPGEHSSLNGLGQAGFCTVVALVGAVATIRPAATAEEGAIRLRDGAMASGIAFRLENHPTPDKRLIETMPGGLAAFDYDNDGLVDLFFANGAPSHSLEKEGRRDWNRLYRNEGGLKFTDVTEQARLRGEGYSMGAAAGDFDNDGHVDLFVAGVGRNLLYRNNGRGAFEDVTARAGLANHTWSVAAAWLDFDRDGLLDLFVVTYLKWSTRDDRFCGDRERDIRVYCHPRHYGGLANSLYRNTGNGRFEDVSAASGIGRHVGKGMSVAVADYDDDGWIDVFVTNDTEPNFLFRNLGNGRFEETALLAGVGVPIHGKPVSSMGVEFRDYDNDGRPDLHVTALAGETFPLFRNDGGGSFSDRTAASGLARATLTRSGWGNLLADLDNDGWKDLFTANSHVNDRVDAFEAHQYREPNSLFRNTGGGTFRDISRDLGPEFQVPRAHRGAVAVDLNNDGRLEVVTTSLSDRVEIWENTTGGANRWIRLRLTGTRGNRDAIGARIHVGRQMQIQATTAGYASSVHAPVHFGVGPLEEIDRLEIVWPSGTRQVLEQVATNRLVEVTERLP